MFCSNCRTQLPDEANFCWKCGKPQKQGVQVEEAKYEICEIKVYHNSSLFNNYFEFYAEAIGPKGAYVVGRTPRFAYSPYRIEIGGGEYRKQYALVMALASELTQAGWEPVPTQGSYTWSYKFRRRV